MAETQRVSLFATLPPPPQNQQDVLRWAVQFQTAMSRNHLALARRLEEIILQGVTADMPTADGSRRFFWDETTSSLYYDSGAWEAV
tara:strand:+ start:502 stop:759 length:258 start_codon:yes stop_codon:yes gene_type:complete